MTNIPPEVLATANAKSRRLKELLLAPEILILPGAFNVLSALLYQYLGFPAIQGSSSGFANALAEAVRRGQAYAEAGGDSVFFFRVRDPAAIRTLVKEIPAPVSILAGPGVPSARELEELGVARVSYGSQFLLVAVGAVKRAAREVLEKHTHELMSDGLDGAEMR